MPPTSKNISNQHDWLIPTHDDADTVFVLGAIGKALSGSVLGPVLVYRHSVAEYE